MRTYFLRINPPKDSEDPPVWLGGDFDEIPDTDDFLELLEQHGIAIPTR